MTAQDVYNLALIFIDEVNNETGAISTENVAGYAGKAPALIDYYQCIVAKAERIETSLITALTDELVISDYSAKALLPLALTYEFLSADKSERAGEFKAEYDRRLMQTGVVVEGFTDDEHITAGSN
jgi:hypothetical protein